MLTDEYGGLMNWWEKTAELGEKYAPCVVPLCP
jgi:hypothetical protein